MIVGIAPARAALCKSSFKVMLANFQAAGVCSADKRTDYETCVVAIREARH
jgi:hypothetical protein